MSEGTGSLSRTAAFAVVMAAVMLLGTPTLNLGDGEGFSAVGSAEAVDVPRNFKLGIGELTADSLNTNTATMVSEYLLIFYCYSYLIGYDVDMNIVGDLATSWESSPDGLTWHFELVDNAYFCDPASPYDTSHPVTASDVVYSFWEIQNHSSGRLYGYFPGIIDHFEYDPADPYELTLVLNQIHAPILESFLYAPILPRYYWEASGDDFTDFANLPPIGSGPLYYATDGLPTMGSAELARNPIWFQTENKGWQLHTDSWFIEEHTSVQSALLELNTGELDCYMRVPAYEYLDVMPGYDNIVGFSQSAGFVYEYNLNQMSDELRAGLTGPITSGTNNQLLLDPTVKMAMAMAVDKDAFVDDVLMGLGSYADSLIPPSNPGHYWVPDPVEFDLEAARQLLWDAGWRYDSIGDPATSDTCPLAKEGGTDVLSFDFITLDTSVVWENAANLIAGWAEDIGVELDLALKSVSTMNGAWYAADYDVWLWDWVMGVTSDPSGILEVLTTGSIGSSSDIYWSDPTFDALYNLSLTTVDPAARQDIFDEMQTMAYWNLGCQCVAYANDNYGVSTLNWDPDSLGDWNTQYFLLPDISAQWPSMQMQPNNNHAPYFTGYTGMDSVVIAEVGVSESFTASGLDDDPLTVKEYRWFWGDGDKTSWSTSGSATHTYAEDGVYEVWVAIREASSSNGFEDYFITSGMATVECYDMSNYPPTGVSFTVDPTDPDAGSYVTFTGTATDPDGDDLYYTWDFGDGHSDAGQVVEYQFGAVGSFTVTLSVTDNRLGHGTRPVTYSDLISVAANQPPTISVSDFADIPVKETRTYTVTASDPEDSMEFTWIWGDGDVSVTSVPSADHMYNVKGTYDLTVWADDLTGLAGHRVSAASHVYVYNPQTNNPPVVSGFSADDITPSTWQEVTFTGSASDLDGDPLTFTVEFGDGSFYVESFGPNSGESITVIVEHTYVSAGAKTARLYVSDGSSNRSSDPLVISVSWNYPPDAFELDDISAYTGELVTVTVDTNDLEGDDLTYTWVWGDGAVDVTVNVATASHTYTEPLDDVYRVYVDDGQGHNVTNAAFVTISPLEETHGLLRVTTNPAVATMISIDGVWASPWGLNWVKLDPGMYELTFSDVPGFVTPDPIEVVIVAGETTTYEANFVPCGSLRVITSPAVPSTIYVDGIPRNDWGFWVDVPAGTYTVSFGAVADYATPDPETVTVTSGGYTEVTGTFASSPGAPGPDPGTYGMLRLTSSPPVPSMIYVDGNWMSPWGLNWVKLSVGTHSLVYSDVPGYVTPSPTTFEIVAGVTTTISADFELCGSLRVITSPAVPSTIYVDDIPRNDWGMWADIPAGTYTVSFGEVPGYATPAPQTVTVVSGGYTEVTGIFAPL